MDAQSPEREPSPCAGGDEGNEGYDGDDCYTGSDDVQTLASASVRRQLQLVSESLARAERGVADKDKECQKKARKIARLQDTVTSLQLQLKSSPRVPAAGDAQQPAAPTVSRVPPAAAATRVDGCPSPARVSRLQACARRRIGGVVVVLEQLEDMGNRAAILRSVEALGFLHVWEVGEQPDSMRFKVRVAVWFCGGWVPRTSPAGRLAGDRRRILCL
jgi:hypothetical protein